MPKEEKNTKHLTLEVRTIIAAGTETSGNSLSVTIFHLLANPGKAQRLKDELLAAQKNNNGRPPTYQELQRLPYLVWTENETLLLPLLTTCFYQNAVVSEGLR
jgi:cytochrome P450